MEPVLFVMAILGCGEGDLPCREVRFTETRYETRDSCLAATEAELIRQSDVEFPVVVAECRPAGQRAEVMLANQVDLPEPEANPNFPPRQPR